MSEIRSWGYFNCENKLSKLYETPIVPFTVVSLIKSVRLLPVNEIGNETPVVPAGKVHFACPRMIVPVFVMETPFTVTCCPSGSCRRSCTRAESERVDFDSLSSAGSGKSASAENL